MKKIQFSPFDKRVAAETLRKLVSFTASGIGVLSIITIAFGVTAIAQCGGSLTSLAASAVALRSQPQPVQSSLQNRSDAKDSANNTGNAAINDSSDDSSIVGLWHVRFMIGNQQIQEAFQIWNAGGTEVHNPNVDPRGGTVCLGVWRAADTRTFKLTHRVWNYDLNGNFMGTINLSENVTVGRKGTTHAGTFALDFYDPLGNFLFEAAGNVIAERIPNE